MDEKVTAPQYKIGDKAYVEVTLVDQWGPSAWAVESDGRGSMLIGAGRLLPIPSAPPVMAGAVTDDQTKEFTRYADVLTRVLDSPHWKPQRSHIECARNLLRDAAALSVAPGRADGNPWKPIAEVTHDDGRRGLLWAEGSDVDAWTWDAGLNRWHQGADHWWAEGWQGPTHFHEVPAPPALTGEKQ